MHHSWKKKVIVIFFLAQYRILSSFSFCINKKTITIPFRLLASSRKKLTLIFKIEPYFNLRFNTRTVIYFAFRSISVQFN